MQKVLNNTTILPPKYLLKSYEFAHSHPWGHFLGSCAQLLHPSSNFLTDFLGEKVELFQMQNCIDIYGLIKPNFSIKSWVNGSNVEHN